MYNTMAKKKHKRTDLQNSTEKTKKGRGVAIGAAIWIPVGIRILGAVLVIEEPLTIRRETSLLRIPCGSDARPGDVTVVNGDWFGWFRFDVPITPSGCLDIRSAAAILVMSLFKSGIKYP
jgi:hypothetical protein